MATKPPVTDTSSTDLSSKTTDDHTNGRATEAPTESRPSRQPLRQVLRGLQWRFLLVVGISAGVLWTVMLTQRSALQFLAGLLPVTAGIIVGRRIKEHVNWYAIFLSLFTLLGAAAAALVVAGVQGLTEPLIAALWLGTITLLPFPAFGVIMSARSEQRARAVREEQAQRGGRLDRPGRVRSLEDLQALSLPQLGGYVADLFRRHGFVIKDYKIEKDKDRIDFKVSYEDQPWLIRVTTIDKVKPGVAQELAQRMKAEDTTKGIIITSTDFQEAAIRWAKDKPVVLIDGPTLLSMDD
jgi:hypothetical protein